MARPVTAEDYERLAMEGPPESPADFQGIGGTAAPALLEPPDDFADEAQALAEHYQAIEATEAPVEFPSTRRGSTGPWTPSRMLGQNTPSDQGLL
jgi:hypothetical protein